MSVDRPPLQSTAPLELPRALLIDLPTGELLRGLPLGVSGAQLRLMCEGQERRIPLPLPAGAILPAAGPRQRRRPPRGPLRLDERPLPKDPWAVVDAEVEERPSLRAVALLDGRATPEDVFASLAGELRLTRGRLTPEARRSGPVVLPLARDPVGAQVVGDGLAAGWASVLLVACSDRALLDHLRALLRVTDGRDGRSMAFRFFDPLVLRALLPTLDADGAARLFGSWRCEGAAGVACPVCDTERDEPGPCAWCGLTLPAGSETVIEAALVPGAEGSFVRGRPAGRLVRSSRGSCRLTVRADQLEVLGDLHARRRGGTTRTDALLERARRLFPDLCARRGPEGTRALVARLIARAQAYELFGTEEVALFVYAALLVDPDFEERPWAWPWLEALHADAPAAERADRLWALARAEYARLRAGRG